MLCEEICFVYISEKVCMPMWDDLLLQVDDSSKKLRFIYDVHKD